MQLTAVKFDTTLLSSAHMMVGFLFHTCIAMFSLRLAPPSAAVSNLRAAGSGSPAAISFCAQSLPRR